MRWEDERYVRVYTRDTAELLALGWEARALFWEVLRKVDRAGLLPLGKTGARGLAAVTGIPAEVVGRALALLLEDGCLQLADGVLVCPNFLAAQDAAQSDRARQREKRARDRERAMGNVESQNVTAPSQDVTESHEVSRGGHDVTPDVTPCCAVPSRAVPPSGGSEAPPAPAPARRVKASKAGTLPGLQLDGGPPESPEGVAWRTWRAAYLQRYQRPYPKQSSDGPAMRRLAALAVELVREMKRPEPDALEVLLAHRWRRYLADPGQSRAPGGKGYLDDTAHRLQDVERGLAAYGTPWDRPAAKASPLPAIAEPRRPAAAPLGANPRAPEEAPGLAGKVLLSAFGGRS